MMIYGREIPNIFIKVCSEFQYATDLINGKIFMNESGYFRKQDNSFRGDINDGKRPIDTKGRQLIFKNEIGEIDLTGASISYGFPGDDKLPIFCCSMQDESILDPPQNQADGSICLNFKNVFLDHITQFGTHAVIFLADEFIHKTNEYLKNNNISAKYGRVEYCELLKRYDFYDVVGEDDIHLPFFRKDMTYAIQNEWRLILINDDKELINSNQDHFTMDIGKLEYAHVIDVKGLRLIVSE